mgnify:CR=1 FL=1
MNPIILLFVYSFIGSVAGLIGGVVLLFKKEWAEKLASISVPLAAGVLLAVSFQLNNFALFNLNNVRILSISTSFSKKSLNKAPSFGNEFENRIKWP